MDAAFPRAHGAAVCSARIRTAPEDFFVEEIASFEPSGAGEHLLLTIEKRGMNTAFATKRIAAWAGVAESAIGYAGLKDRHAVARQRFSVWLPKKVAPDIAALQSDDLGVLEQRIGDVEAKLDHKLLNNVKGLGLPTLENLTRFIWDHVQHAGQIVRVSVYRDSCGESCTDFGPQV